MGVPIELSTCVDISVCCIAHIVSWLRGWCVSLRSLSARKINASPLAVIDAWKLEYRGKDYKALLQAIDEIQSLPIERHYAKIIPVAQSSGTGKSRAVDRIATERILIPMCLREDLGADYFGASRGLCLQLRLNSSQHILLLTLRFATTCSQHLVQTRKGNARHISGRSCGLSLAKRGNSSTSSSILTPRCRMER